MGNAILVIDDKEQNIFSFTALLTANGYDVHPCHSGKEALKYLHTQYHLIDLILIDVQMPEMDGFQTAKLIRKREKTRHIPLIFITGYGQEKMQQLKAYEAGGYDYLTKPIDNDLLLTRIAIFIRLKKTQDALRDRETRLKELNRQLEDRVERRTSELADSIRTIRRTEEKLLNSQKLASLGKLVAGATHEINTPLGIGITTASILTDKAEKTASLMGEGKMTRSHLNGLLQAVIENSAILESNLRKAADLVRSLKVVAVDRCSGENRRFNVKEYIAEILLSLRPKLKNTSHSVFVNCDPELTIESYPGALSQILSNLMMNSLIHGFQQMEKGAITIDIRVEGRSCLLTYSDNGIGIAEAHLPKIFDQYFTTARDRGGSGLGTHIIRTLVTETLGGTISCRSTPGEGASFHLRFPLHSRPA